LRRYAAALPRKSMRPHSRVYLKCQHLAAGIDGAATLAKLENINFVSAGALISF
jgi:hypothetical protein